MTMSLGKDEQSTTNEERNRDVSYIRTPWIVKSRNEGSVRGRDAGPSRIRPIRSCPQTPEASGM